MFCVETAADLAAKLSWVMGEHHPLDIANGDKTRLSFIRYLAKFSV